jgi:hypothetical protein
MATNAYDFYDEVVVVDSPSRPEFIGTTGIVAGITEGVDDDGNPSYGIMLDGYDRAVMFEGGQLRPTGQRREPED